MFYQSRAHILCALSAFFLVAFSVGVTDASPAGSNSSPTYAHDLEVREREDVLLSAAAIPYRSFADSPFTGQLGGASYFHLETFEDGELDSPGISDNTRAMLLTISHSLIPGAEVSPPTPLFEDRSGWVLEPGPFGNLTDSVDLDDGSLDGSGLEGKSYRQGRSDWTTIRTLGPFEQLVAITNRLDFSFDQSALGELPDSFGFALTDVPVAGGQLIVDIIDSDGLSRQLIGTDSGQFTPPLYIPKATNGSTSDDLFFGVTSTTDIAFLSIQYTTFTTRVLPQEGQGPFSGLEIEISGLGDLPLRDNALEIDHVQYGLLNPSAAKSAPAAQTPEPGGAVLCLAAALSVARARRRASHGAADA